MTYDHRHRLEELILDAAGEGIVGTDARGTITFANPAAARMTGYAAEELAGRDLHATLHHSRADGSVYDAADCPMHASLRDQSIHHCDADVYWRKDGTRFAVEFTSTPIVEDRRTGGAVVVFRNIDERLEIARVKEQFTSVVSHELRTPLTSIRGSLGLLDSGALGPLPEQGRRMVRIAVQNTDRLIRLINDILDLERIDSGVVELVRTPCDAEELVASATEAVLPIAVAAQVVLAVAAEPAALAADADLMIQTLTNLIANAVKFSAPGDTVRVSAERDGGEILFAVSDVGSGIPADNLESIFGRFEQVDASDSRRKGGTGLGLAICRSIVEKHGGRIWAQSVLGEGSTFSFLVPVAAAGEEDLPPLPAEACA
jgi:PAS domain S-box-containing protein